MKKCSTILALLLGLAAASRGETLYNGIVLPAQWPPTASIPNSNPVPPPAWLQTPPAVIPIDVGRQLFVDDFLISESTLTKTQHQPIYYSGNPLPTVGLPFSDGVWYDPYQKTFRIWDHHNGGNNVATSADGITWTNYHQVLSGNTNSTTLWIDQATTNPAQRYVYQVDNSDGTNFLCYFYFSSDGKAFTLGRTETNKIGDRSTIFYNPFRKKWVLSQRAPDTLRYRAYEELNNIASDPIAGYNSDPKWCACDNLDPPGPDGTQPQLYNLDAVGYESLMLGMYTVLRGHDYSRTAGGNGGEMNDVCIAWSRDGWYWERPNRQPICPIVNTPGTWNYCNVQSCGGCLLIVNDQLYIYASGRGIAGNYAGLSKIRRDGFTSVDGGVSEGSLTTRTVKFSGKNMFVNVNDPAGALRVEVLDESGNVIAPFSRANCNPVSVDKTRQRVTWTGASDLSAVANRNVHFKFYLANGALYAFWVSPDLSGASYGYVAAGGPEFTSEKDTVGGPVPLIYGDANGDGAFGMADVNQMVDWLLVRTAPPAAGTAAFIRSDVNGDGLLTMADLNLYVDKLLGRIQKFPVEP
jgi:hypothetical protein